MIKEVELNIHRIKYAQYVSAELWKQFQLTAHIDAFYHHQTYTVVNEIEFRFYGEDPTVFEYEHPSTWWEHFKFFLYYDWFPTHFEWVGDVIRKRWPVRKTKHTFDLMALYPDIRVDRQQSRVLLYRVERSIPVSQMVAKKKDWNDDL